MLIISVVWKLSKLKVGLSVLLDRVILGRVYHLHVYYRILSTKIRLSLEIVCCFWNLDWSNRNIILMHYRLTSSENRGLRIYLRCKLSRSGLTIANDSLKGLCLGSECRWGCSGERITGLRFRLEKRILTSGLLIRSWRQKWVVLDLMRRRSSLYRLNGKVRYPLIQLCLRDRLASLLLFRNWLGCKLNRLIGDLAGHVRNLETVWHDCHNRSSTRLTGFNLYLVYGFIEFLSFRLSLADLSLSNLHNGSILDRIRFEDFGFGVCRLNWFLYLVLGWLKFSTINKWHRLGGRICVQYSSAVVDFYLLKRGLGLAELRLFQFEDLHLVSHLLEIFAQLLVFGFELLLAFQNLLFSFFLFFALEFTLLLENG